MFLMCSDNLESLGVPCPFYRFKDIQSHNVLSDGPKAFF